MTKRFGMTNATQIQFEKGEDSWRLQTLNGKNWQQFENDILRIESESYESARQCPPSLLAQVACDPAGISLVVSQGERIAGFCLAAPLEVFPDVLGTQMDSHWGARNSLYAVDLTVSIGFRGMGLGKLLKYQQLRHARIQRYRYVAGRNRVGLAQSMIRINFSFGAKKLFLLKGAYRDNLVPDIALYYRIDVNGQNKYHEPQI